MPNKYCCLDVVPTDFLKKCLPYLLGYLKYIINQSLETGIFPSKYKDTILKPSIKDNSVDKDLHCNYRPLSNLCFISKVMERSVLNQLVEHLQTNNLFGEFQSAYRKFHSCETAITKITNDILFTLDNKECFFILFLDLSSAFDTVDRSILLSVLNKKYGVTGLALKWIESYLGNRHCYVNIDDCFSSGFLLLFGVPQGSILGPILFILYISEIENIAKCYGFKIHIYADDSQLYISFQRYDILSTVSNIEHCLRDIKHWMSVNFLKINQDKTKFLFISPYESMHSAYKDICISFSGSIICPSLDVVNLGVTFDSSISMQAHINGIVSRGYCYLSNFWRVADKLNKDLKLQLVTSYILPIIDYCNITFVAASANSIQKLQKLLNSAVRYICNITGKRCRLPITSYMKELHILPVSYRIKYKIAVTVYKCVQGLAPFYLQDLIKPKVTFSHLRSSNDVFSLHTIVPKSHYGESAFSYIAPVVWNELPQNLRLTSTVETFKSLLKTHYFKEHYGSD